MCGIVGYIGDRSAISVLLDGLQHLEYRGYDSAGVAVIQDDQVITHRSVGKLANLIQKIDRRELHGTVGIGHTRWATHGRPTEVNAHPHQEGRVVLVHNGIIENYLDLRRKLEKLGHSFTSETDTEILCHLVAEQLKKTKQMQPAIQKALALVEGSYAIVVMDAEDPDRLYFARQGSPLVLGLGEKENILASDVPAILAYTRKMVFLEDGDRGVISAKKFEIFDAKGKPVKRKVAQIDWDPVMAEKGGYKHFMLKEIFEQPKVIGDTLAGRISAKHGVVLPELAELFGSKKFDVDHIQFVACGTSWHAAGVARYWIESLCGIPVSVDLASEFRYRNPVIGKKTLCVAISQSGETADTLAAAQLAKRRGAKLIAVCNVQGSSVTRLAHATLYTRAGPEIGVASTKAFTTQLTVLWLLTLWLSRKLKKIKTAALEQEVKALKRLPGLVQTSLESHNEVRALAKQFMNASPVLFIGRGTHYPVVLEGALKLKEIAYIHAEGFAAGELKHGPIALVDQDVPVIALLPQGDLLEKMISNIQEVAARGASVLMIGEKNCFPKGMGTAHIPMPKASSYLTPILYVVPLQLFAYDIADQMGTDIDQPRNLAKSVTVE
ncbi:MAG: glutamine--fructose-6-phosphate transaminase (isomerizing) [Deltaproteobacteria bacterium CG11_big_fil_rev_8_21_14_0_20_47_16]|nr:MAG: glutamine--fructose-6-phosphate transaminase (isomerizing) [Deltaproteobacteria bacterium CG11_big_fil_rev_8_21_14_0_20_47_16]